MSQERFRSFEEFWPFYVREHSKKATRRLHFLGTTGAMACLAAGLITGQRWLFAAAPVIGYGPSWVGHFFIEKNRPATFAHPLWSLAADMKMWSLMVRGQMDEEVARVERDVAEAATGAAAASGAEASRVEVGTTGAAVPRETLN